MKVHPFIEAEKVAGHSVKRCCELLEVSRAAFYERLDATPPRPRSSSDAELTETDHRHPHRVQGHLWVARGSTRP